MAFRHAQALKKGVTFTYGGEYDEISVAPRQVPMLFPQQDQMEQQRADPQQEVKSLKMILATSAKSREEQTYQALVAKCSYNDFTYDDHFLQPGLGFYKWIARKIDPSQDDSRDKLMLNIPDTIIYGYADEPIWLYTGKTGCVQRVDSFAETAVLRKFRSLINKDSDITAIVKKPGLKSHGRTTVVSIANLHELRSIMNPILSPNKSQVIIQLYIKPKGPKAFMVRVEWNRSRVCSAWSISNKKMFSDTNVEDNKQHYIDFGTINSVSIVKMQGKSVEHLQGLTTRFVQHLERRIRPVVKFQTIVVDFIKDDFDRWWLIQVKAFKLDPSTLSLSRSQSPTLEAGNTIMSGFDLTTSKQDSQARPKSPSGSKKIYVRVLECSACRVRYSDRDLQHQISAKLLLETVDHLKKRGKTLPWFDGFESDMLHDPNMEEMTELKICTSCNNLHILEQKLILIEAQFSRLLNIQMLDGTEHRDDSAKIFEEYEVPSGLKPYRMMVFVKALRGIPNLENIYGSGTYSLCYKILGRVIRIPLPKGPEQELDLMNLRVFHLFLLEHGAGTADYLKKIKGLDVYILSSESSTPCTAVQIPLDALASQPNSIMSERALLINREGLPPFYADILVGFSTCHYANPQMAGPLRFIHGAYVPITTFFTCDPLPLEWIGALSHSRSHSIEEKKPTLVSVSEERKAVESTKKSRLTQEHQLQVVKIWILKIQLQSLKNFGNEFRDDIWSIQYSIFDRNCRFRMATDHHGGAVFPEESTRLYLRCSASALRRLLMEQEPLALLLVKVISSCVSHMFVSPSLVVSIYFQDVHTIIQENIFGRFTQSVFQGY
eukprot:TRINITY_DN5092_c0_g1_i3.p1 TRINITY_DN5092_c0_g1~~TRINITY_DN5092_c0_g1_i3.p1  ORF type:complete len:832 (-),score=133.58 TRINITY_DN5092_c0_g1_i3:777-3272(-)